LKKDKDIPTEIIINRKKDKNGLFSLTVKHAHYSEVSLAKGIKLPVDTGQDWYEIPFRLLSASIIPGHWLNLTLPGVLKRALKKFDGLTLFTDHYDAIPNWTGKVENVVWDTNEPMGINGMVKVSRERDLITQQSLILGLSSGALRHGSSSFIMKWKPSHPDMDINTFFDMLGEEVDGKIVTIDVTEILDVCEFSLVSYGGDRDAMPRAALTVEVDEEEIETEKENEKNKKLKLEAQMQKALIAILTALGIAIPEGADEKALEALVVTGTAKAIELKEKAGKYEGVISAKREALKARLNILKEAGKPVSESVALAIEGANEVTLSSFETLIEAQILAVIPPGGRSSGPTPPATDPVKLETKKEPDEFGSKSV
jgi:hypothetical protein